MSTRTIADIEADIIAVKNANPNWLTNAGVIALIMSLTTQINDLSASMQPAGNYLHTTFNSLSYFHYKYIKIIIFSQYLCLFRALNYLIATKLFLRNYLSSYQKLYCYLILYLESWTGLPFDNYAVFYINIPIFYAVFCNSNRNSDVLLLLLLLLSMYFILIVDYYFLGPSRKIIQVKVSDDSTPIQISIEISSMPVDQIVKSKLTAYLQASEGTYDYFKLYTREQVEVGDVATLIDNAVYFFKPPIQLDPQSGSRWTQKQLVELKVVFDRMPIEEDFFELSTARSDQTEALIIELQDLTSGTIDRYRELRSGASRDDQSLNFLQDSIYKAVYMVQK